MTQLEFDERELIENPANRLALGICLDGSWSMEGEPHDALNKGLQKFFTEVWDDEIARLSVEVAIVTFASNVEIVREFAPMVNATAPHVPLLGGATCLGAGVKRTLDLIEDRKASYQGAGLQYYQPWLVLISDGCPTDDEHLSLAPRIERLVKSKKLTVFALGVGDCADLDALAVLSPKRPPLRLKGLKFTDFFEFLSQSASQVSASQIDDEVKLDTSGFDKWAEM